MPPPGPWHSVGAMVADDASPVLSVHHARWTEMDPRTAYALARIRFEVFVTEQEITMEQDLDGLDLEPWVEQWWVEADGEPVATMRYLDAPASPEGRGLRSVGRVSTLPGHRGKGLASRLLQEILAAAGDQPMEIHAQAYLEQWYGRFGFRTQGETFLEAGIPHVSMRREPPAA